VSSRSHRFARFRVTLGVSGHCLGGAVGGVDKKDLGPPLQIEELAAVYVSLPSANNDALRRLYRDSLIDHGCQAARRR
jgi:hypothetical protein